MDLSEVELSRLSAALSAARGLFVVVGNVDSGMNGALHRCLQPLVDGQRILYSIESPIERPLPGVKQLETDPKNGVYLADLLRSLQDRQFDVLRIDLLVDTETAQLALEASERRLVLAGCYAYDVIGAVVRLGDCGMDTNLLAERLIGVWAPGHPGCVGTVLLGSQPLRRLIRSGASEQALRAALTADLSPP